MVEKEDIFSSKVKYSGIFNFPDFYKFCYDWLVDEEEFIVSEDKYTEKLAGDAKNVEIIWRGFRKITDYFKFEIKVDFRIIGLAQAEITQGGVKLKTNKGTIEIKITGTLARDYNGKFEKTAGQKFMRSIYEKWVIPTRVDQYEDKLAGICDGFLGQTKAWLDLEGKH
jgi:hypothetical protein